MKKENIKRAFITVGLIGILAASPVMAEVSRLSVPSVGDTVEIDDLLLRVLAFPEHEPNRYTKSGAGKFAPEELEKGLLIKADMALGEGNPNGMMAPVHDSFKDIYATVEEDPEEGTVTITFNGNVLKLYEGSSTAVYNGNELEIPDGLSPYFYQVPEEVREDGSPYYACYVPVKFVCETLGGRVTWDDDMDRLLCSFAIFEVEAAKVPSTGGRFYTNGNLMNMGYNETGVNFGKTLLKYKKDAVTAGLSIVDPRYQNKDGGWAKTNTGYNLVDPEFAELIPYGPSSIDNNATILQIIYLSRLIHTYTEMPEEFQDIPDIEEKMTTIEKGFWKAIKYVLDAQTEEGGWRQYWPYSVGYFKEVTYNDNAMVQMMNILLDIVEPDVSESEIGKFMAHDMDWARERLLKEPEADVLKQGDMVITYEAIKEAWDKALSYTLEHQIVTDYKGEEMKTAWSLQYDPETGEPSGGRAFELPAIGTTESQVIVQLLQRIPNPTPEICEAINTFNEWVELLGVTGMRDVDVKDRTRELDKDRRFIIDKESPYRMYGRFYGLDTTGEYYRENYGMTEELEEEGFYPVYSGRDQIAHLNHNLTPVERRSGYGFLKADCGKYVKSDYAEWEAWLKENGWSVNGLPIATMSNALKATPSEAVQGGKPETATKSDADKATGSNADNITAKNIPGLGGSNR